MSHEIREVRVERPLGDQTLTLSTGKLAKQANGAVVVQYGDTVILAAATAGPAREGIDFFPLTVDYREKLYAAGKFPGGFIKREGAPRSKEILTARLVDRPIRPLFPEWYRDEVQVLLGTLSADRQNDPDMLSMIGGSAALHVSDLPFLGPTGSIRIGRIKKQLVVMPTVQQLAESDLDLVISCTEKSVLMIEGFGDEIPDDEMAAAIDFAYEQCRIIIAMQHELREKTGRGSKSIPPAPPANPAASAVRERYYGAMQQAKQIVGKLERRDATAALLEKALGELVPETPSNGAPSEDQVREAFYGLEQRVMRDAILGGRRADGRGLKDIRSLYCEVSILPRTHGSAIFARGETQALVTTTLGTASDGQRVDGLADEYTKRFMLDYNMPPFSVGEVRPIRGPGRREIGHGALAERSLKPVVPAPEAFPYVIRVVSDILESNGSSSMASVCGGTLSMMDAGVPISQPVAGISIGLIKEPDGRYVLLTDIIGDEDHYGDMDFKVAGTQNGITGIQLDLKIDGISAEIVRATLVQAREGRLSILRTMLQCIERPRDQISRHAPRLIQIRINPDKIGLLIGPGGKNIRRMEEESGANIEIEDDGTVTVSSINADAAEKAAEQVRLLTEEVQVGKIYNGRVISIKDFGAFIEILPGKDGLCHISELSDGYVERVDDVCKVGDTLQVKVILVDDQDRVKLSRKAVLQDESGGAPSSGEGSGEGYRDRPREPRGDRGGGGGGGDRGGRGGRDRGGRGGGDRGGRGGGGGGGGGDRGGGRPQGQGYRGGPGGEQPEEDRGNR
jgi:polyribonucleotide nucleotidyltransferase